MLAAAAAVALTAVGVSWWLWHSRKAGSGMGGAPSTSGAAAADLRPGQPAAGLPPPEKIGAGMLLCCNGEVLLLRRNSANNYNKLGLPGGNADPEDAGDLLVTARREAMEEMGGLPEHQVVDIIVTRRGERLQKEFTVYVASVTPAARQAWTPALNEEHSEGLWVPAEQLAGRLAAGELHPVVKKLLRHEGPRTLAAIRRSAA